MFGAAGKACTDLDLTVQRALAMVSEAMMATRAARRPVPPEAPEAARLEDAAGHLEDARIDLQGALR